MKKKQINELELLDTIEEIKECITEAKYVSAIMSAKICLKELEEHKELNEYKQRIVLLLALAYRKGGYYDSAIDCLKNAKVDFIQNSDEELFNARLFVNIGINYECKKESKKAKTYYQKAMCIFKKYDSEDDIKRLNLTIELMDK